MNTGVREAELWTGERRQGVEEGQGPGTAQETEQEENNDDGPGPRGRELRDR